MRLILVFLFAVKLGIAVGQVPVASECPEESCLPPDCRCSSTSIPGGMEARDTPQFVMINFNDGLTAQLVDEFYFFPLLTRTNPDGCPASISFFISHTATDYSKVNEMYNLGYEIGLSSISSRTDQEFWRDANVADLQIEFEHQRQLTSHFANIPADAMQGIRSPFFQMAGDNTFMMMLQSNFLYDFSWPTQTFIDPGLWPYTLDHSSSQDCGIAPCPTDSFPGRWVLPIINWFDDENVPCILADGCTNIENTADAIFQFMVRNFKRQYLGNRAPFSFSATGAWFLANPNAFEAYRMFIDHLDQLPDVYIVTPSKVIEWIRNPVPLGKLFGPTSDWHSCTRPEIGRACFPVACQLSSDAHTGIQVMAQCGTCPSRFPWVGNPLGS